MITRSVAAAAALSILAFAGSPLRAATDDSAFLTDAMQGDNAEVAMGHMAEKQGATAKVRAYGRMLVTDHGAHRQKLGMLADKMGVPRTDAIPADAQQSAAMMQELHGGAFDTAFRKDMIEDHEKDIAKYQHAAHDAQSPVVRHMAMQTLPTLHKHLMRARAL